MSGLWSRDGSRGTGEIAAGGDTRGGASKTGGSCHSSSIYAHKVLVDLSACGMARRKPWPVLEGSIRPISKLRWVRRARLGIVGRGRHSPTHRGITKIPVFQRTIMMVQAPSHEPSPSRLHPAHHTGRISTGTVRNQQQQAIACGPALTCTGLDSREPRESRGLSNGYAALPNTYLPSR